MRSFILHRSISIALLLILALINWIVSGTGWFFWIAITWVMILVIHFCIVRSIDVDEDWADERARDLRLKSYDYRHIDAIRSSYIKPRKRQKNKK